MQTNNCISPLMIHVAFFISYNTLHKATKASHGLVLPVRVWVSKVLCLSGVDWGEVTEPVPCGPQAWILDLASVILWWWPAEGVLGRDGRNHNFHLGSNGLVGWEIVVFHQNLVRALVASHVGFDLGMMLVLLRIQMDVTARDVNAQLVSLHLLRLHSGSLLVVDAGQGRVFIAAGFGGYTGSVRVLCVLVHCRSEAVLQSKTSDPVCLSSMIVLINWEENKKRMNEWVLHCSFSM